MPIYMGAGSVQVTAAGMRSAAREKEKVKVRELDNTNQFEV